MRPLVESKRWPARTARVLGAGAHLYTPPSVPTQGVGPAPPRGVWGAGCPKTEPARLPPSAAAFIAYRTDFPPSRTSTFLKALPRRTRRTRRFTFLTPSPTAATRRRDR